MSRTDNLATGIKGVATDPMTGKPIKVWNEEDHFFTCDVCGQSVDMRDLGEVFHHEGADHKPLPIS